MGDLVTFHYQQTIDGFVFPIIIGEVGVPESGAGPLSFNEWFDITQNVSWTTIDKRDWRGRFFEITAVRDSGTPIDDGSWAEENIKHKDILTSTMTQQEDFKWFRGYITNNPLALPYEFTQFDSDVGGSSTTFIKIRASSGGTLQLEVTNYNIEISYRIWIRSSGKIPASEAIVI